MKTPTIEEVINRYKSAKIVYSAFFKEAFDITEYDFDSVYRHGGSVYIVHSTDKSYVKSLLDINSGFAEVSNTNILEQ